MRSSSEKFYTARDGAKIAYHYWPATGHYRGNLVLLQRGHEHSGRWHEFVDGLELEDFTIIAWDHRDRGKSVGERGGAEGVHQLESDLQDVLLQLQLEAEQTVVVAHSLAAVVAGLWAVDYGPRLRGLVLARPALEVKLYVPFAREGLALARHLGLMPKVQSYVRGSALTHDRERAQDYDTDPLVERPISTDLLLDLGQASRRLQKLACNLEMPVQVLAARADWVVKNLPIRRFFRNLPSKDKAIKVYRDFYHHIFQEKGRQQVFSDIREFVLECFEKVVDRKHLLAADRHGLSAERLEWHKAGPPRPPGGILSTRCRVGR